MEGYVLRIDHRERAIVPNFQNATCKYTYPIILEQLAVGDFVVSYNGKILFIIERKTYNDLSATWKDPARKFNYKKMLEVRDATNCKVFYGIEGDACPPDAKEFGHVEYHILRAHLDHLTFDHDIHVFYAKTKDDFVRRVFGMMHAYATRACKPLDDVKIAGNETDMLKHKSVEFCMNDTMQKMWNSIKGVTRATAGVLNGAIDIRKLMLGKVTTDEIANLKYPSGICIGQARAKNIITNAMEFETQCKIASIQGVSDKTAKFILSTFKLEDIINGVVTVQMIADLKRPTGTRIGNKIADQLCCAMQLNPVVDMKLANLLDQLVKN